MRLKALYLIIVGFLLFKNNALATHIVGGALTYEQISDSAYIVTLKLYRDCAPGNADFINPAIINVVSESGQFFNPDISLSIPLSPTTFLEPIIDTCVIDPGICVEEAIYIDTLKGLNPLLAYHMYFQTCCRNSTVINTTSPLTTGESFYAYIPPSRLPYPDPESLAIWYEDFNLPNGTIQDSGLTAWTRTTGLSTDAASVNNGCYQVVDTDAEIFWISDTIIISAYPQGVNVRLNIFNSGNLETWEDSVKVYYNLDFAGDVLFPINGLAAGTANIGFTARADTLSGDTLIIKISMQTNSNDEYYRVDDVLVYDIPPDSIVINGNSSPLWNNFPPIFVCLNQPLVFDHSATDLDGDSLVYSFYKPYNGKLASQGDYTSYLPGFANDSAYFRPINWVAGYDENNPLGPGASSINPQTGELIITPPTQGQFVVGIRVDEWRDSIHLGYTIRDFQFNVLYCPPIAIAGIIDSSNCGDSTFYFDSDITANSYFWDFGDASNPNDTSWSQNTSYHYPDSGDYTIRLITNYNTPCADTTFDTITVKWIVPSFTIDTPSCVGEAINFTNTSTYSNNLQGITWLWRMENTDTFNTINASYTYPSAGNYNVSLIINDNIDCIDSVVNPLSITTAPVSNAGNNTTVCANIGQVNLNGSITGASGGFWNSLGDGYFDNDTLLNATYFLGPIDTASAYVDLVLLSTGNGVCQQVSDTIRITVTPAPSVMHGIDKSICFGQTGVSINTNPFGGTPPYFYNWSTGHTISSINVGAGTYRVSVTDASGCPPSVDTITVTEYTEVIKAFAGNDTTFCIENIPFPLNGRVTGANYGAWLGGLGTYNPSADSLQTFYTPHPTEITAGNFSLQLRTSDNGTCAADTATINITIEDLSAIKDSIIPTCSFSNGSAILTPLGGTPPFQYTWSPNALGQTDSIASNLYTGLYVVTVTDKYGCQLVESFNLDNMEPDLSITDTNHVVCTGEATGSATVQAQGGTPGYTYQWGVQAGSQTSSTAINLSAGNYTVTVTDAVNCPAIITVEILNLFDSINLQIDSIKPLFCFGDNDGYIEVSASGGTGNYTFVWSTNPFQYGNTISNLGDGNYVVTAIDDSMCANYLSIPLLQPNPLQSNISTITNYNGYPISCYDSSDASVLVQIVGGSGSYNYLWSDSLNSTTAMASNLSATQYYITATDSLGCAIIDSIELNQPPAIFLNPGVSSNYNGQHISCFGLNDGSAFVNASGGVGNYSYAWNDALSQQSQQANNLYAGTYNITITDANGCVNYTYITLQQPDSLQFSLTPTNVICVGDTNGSISATPTGGTPNYQFAWDDLSGFQTTATAINLGVATYSITVTDINGCQAIDSASVAGPYVVDMVLSNSDTLCPGEPVTLNAQGSGGNGSYSYFWDQGLGAGQSHTVNPTQTTTYAVEVFDFLGCTALPDSITIFVYTFNPDSLTTSDGGPVCSGRKSWVEAIYNGVLPPYTYTWSHGLGNGTGPKLVYPTDTTWYSVTVTDYCNNEFVDSIEIQAHPYPNLDAFSDTLRGCQSLEVLLIDSTGLNPDATYTWYSPKKDTVFGNGNSMTFPNTGYFYIGLSIVSNNGCTSKKDSALVVQVYPKPQITCSADPKVTDLFLSNISFTASSGMSSYLWDFGDPYSQEEFPSTIREPKHQYTDTGVYTYYVIVSNEFECLDTCYNEVAIIPNFNLQVPNAFIPSTTGSNGGILDPNSEENTVFYPVMHNVTDIHFMVFNRWGEMVFESTELNKGWDGYYRGELLQQDVYVWKIRATFVDQYIKVLTGDVTLIR